MVEDKLIVDKLIEFYKIIYDLQNIKVKVDDEDKTRLLLTLLLKYFENFNYIFLW